MSYIIDDTGDLLLSNFNGVADLACILAYADELVLTEGFPYKCQLVDYSQITKIDLTSEDIGKYVNRFQLHFSVMEVDSDRRIAVCAPSDLQFGFARMIGARGDVFPSNIRAFRGHAECMEWLSGVRPNCDDAVNNNPYGNSYLM